MTAINTSNHVKNIEDELRKAAKNRLVIALMKDFHSVGDWTEARAVGNDYFIDYNHPESPYQERGERPYNELFNAGACSVESSPEGIRVYFWRPEQHSPGSYERW